MLSANIIARTQTWGQMLQTMLVYMALCSTVEGATCAAEQPSGGKYVVGKQPRAIQPETMTIICQQ